MGKTAAAAIKKLWSLRCGFLLPGKPFPVPQDLLLVAVCLGKDTAAVLLHVKSQFPGFLIARPEVGPEVPIEKLHAVLPGIALRRPGDVIVLLIGAGQQGGGEGGKPMVAA